MRPTKAELLRRKLLIAELKEHHKNVSLRYALEEFFAEGRANLPYVEVRSDEKGSRISFRLDVKG
jgi:hypothetical protein